MSTSSADNNSSATPPFLLFDDGGWMSVYQSTAEVADALEWPYVSEVELAVDRRGNRLQLEVIDESVRVVVTDFQVPEAELHRRVNDFFDQWSKYAVTLLSFEGASYVEMVAQAYEGTAFRQRPRHSHRRHL